MSSKEEIEKVNKILSCDNCPTSYACEGCEITWTDKQLLKKYIAQLEQENKALKSDLDSHIKLCFDKDGDTGKMFRFKHKRR